MADQLVRINVFAGARSAFVTSDEVCFEGFCFEFCEIDVSEILRSQDFINTICKDVEGALFALRQDELEAITPYLFAENTDFFVDHILVFEDMHSPYFQERLTDVQHILACAVPDLEHQTVLRAFKTAYEQHSHLIDLRKNIRARGSAIGLMRAGFFELQTPMEARNLSTMLGLFCPKAEMVGTGLFEVIMNAIEHGNLGIGTNQKQQLIKTNMLTDEIERRLNLPAYKDKKVTVQFEEKPECFVFRIEDEGEGFAYEAFEDIRTDCQSFSGRGICIAKCLCFDDLQYEKGGTVAIAKVFK